LKKQRSRIYTDIVFKRYKQLAFYPSIKGFSMADTKTIAGKTKILYKKFISKNKHFDGYNTDATHNIFSSMIKREFKSTALPLLFGDMDVSSGIKPVVLSLMYWTNYINRQYQ